MNGFAVLTAFLLGIAVGDAVGPLAYVAVPLVVGLIIGRSFAS